MSSSLETQAARSSSLQQMRQLLLKRLARANNQIATAQERLTALAAKMAVLAKAKGKAA